MKTARSAQRSSSPANVTSSPSPGVRRSVSWPKPPCWSVSGSLGLALGCALLFALCHVVALLQVLVPITEDVGVSYELHRFIIGQKGSGIRKMMEEYEVT